MDINYDFFSRKVRYFRLRVRRLLLSTLIIVFSKKLDHLDVTPSFTYDTCLETDGGGAQLHSRIATWAFARAVGARFLNTPMRKVDHGTDEQWVSRWNQLIKFQPETKIESPSTEASMTVLGVLLANWKPKKILNINVKNPHYFTDAFPEAIQDIRSDLRELFQSATPNSDWTCDFGIHLRLLQPKDVDFTSSRLSSLEQIVSKLDLLESSKEVVVFASPVAERNLPDVPEHFSFCTDDALTTISKMVLAKNLVIGKSSMSYVAGLLSEQTVWYPEFWHPPMPDWKRL